MDRTKNMISSGTSVSTLVSNDILEKHRYYIRSVAEVIQFLAVNDLAFRGNYVKDYETLRKGIIHKLIRIYFEKKMKSWSNVSNIFQKMLLQIYKTKL